MAQVVCEPLYVVDAQPQPLVQVEDVVVAWHRGAFEPLVCDQKEIQMARGSDAFCGHVLGDDPDVPLAALIPVHRGRAWLSHCPLDG